LEALYREMSSMIAGQQAISWLMRLTRLLS
jgi:hypothetical protein